MTRIIPPKIGNDEIPETSSNFFKKILIGILSKIVTTTPITPDENQLLMFQH